MKAGVVFSGVGPAEVLAAAARRLGIPFDVQALFERFEAHSSPRSLLALVQIAKELGLEARAFESDRAGLAEAALPAVVHLHHAKQDEDSFALILEHGPRGVVLEDPAGLGRQSLSSEEFDALWSGVVVLLSVEEHPVPRPLTRPSLLHGIGRHLASLDAGAAAAEVARPLGLLAMLALAGIGAYRLGPLKSTPWAAVIAAAMVALDLLGAFLCTALYLASRWTRVPSATPRLAAKICGRGKLADCEGVLGSRYARIAGIELSAIGLAFFASSFVLAAVAGVVPAEARLHVYAWLAVAHLVALPGALALIGVQFWPLRRFCPLCMSVHAVVIVCAVLGLPLALGIGGISGGILGIVPFVTLQVVAFLGAFALLLPYLELGLESRALLARMGWVSATPLGALAELAGRPPAAFGQLPAPIRLGDETARFKVDALIHPLCPGCPPVIEDLAEMVERSRGALQVGFHLPPRDPGVAADRELCVALATVGLVAGGEQTLHVLRAVKENPWRRLETAKGGALRVLAEFLPAETPVQSALIEAREAVDRAGRLADALKRGTPTLLLNGRLWDAPLEDLGALLSRKPELVAEILGIPPH